MRKPARPNVGVLIATLSVAWPAVASARQSELYRIDGATGGSNFGFRVAALGDVDGDGVNDFVVGAPADRNTGGGRATVHSGADGAIVHEWFGIGPTDAFGSDVASAGDCDGDGVDDLLVGALGETDPATGRASGSTTLYSGASGLALRTWYGNFDGEDFGAAVASVGDVDGDGVDDTLIGAPWADVGKLDSGSAYLYSGATGAFLARIDGVNKDDGLGGGVAAMGDLDLDGAGDFAVGLPHRNSSGFHDSGAIWVYSGATRTRLYTILGDASDLHLGGVIAGGIDLDGDGLGDLVGGAPTWSAAATNQGLVRAWSGATGALLWELSGAQAYELLGSAVALADRDGDGQPELLVGAGDRTVLRASARLLAPDGSLLHSWASLTGDALGSSLGVLGDADGDGTLDFLLGAPHGDDGSNTFPGSVHVVAGSDLWLDVEPKDLGAGAAATTTIRVGVPYALTMRFVVDVNGTPTFVGLPPPVTFDGAGNVAYLEYIPPGLAGITATLRAYAIGASGKLVDSNDETIELL